MPYTSTDFIFIKNYIKHSYYLSIWHLGSTLVLYFAIIIYGNWFTLPLLALCNCKLSIIFHDLVHHSYFPSRKFDGLIGTLIGIITLNPYKHWKIFHSYHHRDFNNLDKPQYNQTSTLTVDEWEYLSPLYQTIHKIFRSGYGLLMFPLNQIPDSYIPFKGHWYEIIGSISYMVCIYLFPTHLKFKCLGRFPIFMVGWLLNYPIALFFMHTQHTFIGSYRRRSKEWNQIDSSLFGCSYVILPWWLSFFTLNFEYHHIHHLNTKIPSYRLKQCHNDHINEFHMVHRLTLLEILSSFKYSLYDEHNQKFI